MCDTGHPKLVLCGNLEGWVERKVGWGFRMEGSQDGGDISITMAYSY